MLVILTKHFLLLGYLLQVSLYREGHTMFSAEAALQTAMNAHDTDVTMGNGYVVSVKKERERKRERETHT